MTTRTEFLDAVKRLLGDVHFGYMEQVGSTYHDYCKEVALEGFVGELEKYPGAEADMALVSAVAKRLWKGDGVSGLAEG